MAKWKKYKPDGLIKKLEKERTINSEGKVQFSGFSMLSTPSKLAAMIDFHPEISLDVQSGILSQSLFAAGIEVLTPESILNEVNKNEKDLLATCEKKYILITNISIDSLQHKLSSICINDSRLTFPQSLPQTFAKEIKNDYQIRHFYAENGCPANYINVKISVSAKSIFRAAEKALTSINLFRGLLNFALNFGQSSYSFSGDSRKPINKLSLGPIHTLHNCDGKMADSNLFWYEEDYRKPLKAFRESSIVDFSKRLNWVEKLRKKLDKNKIKDTLNEALLLYNEALDSYNYEISYIKLWIVLELLTGKLPNDTQEKAVKRAAFVFQNPQEAENDIMMLKDCRNSLSHKGFMNAKIETFVYDLKMFVEYIFRFLVYNSSRFHNYDDVRLLLDSSRDNIELYKKKRVMDFAKKINQNRL